MPEQTASLVSSGLKEQYCM